MTPEAEKALEEKARECAESIYYDEDTKTVKASEEWLVYVASEIAAVLREVAEEAKREEAEAWELAVVDAREGDYGRFSQYRKAACDEILRRRGVRP